MIPPGENAMMTYALPIAIALLLVPSARSAEESFDYGFAHPREMQEFEVKSGKWNIFAGALKCSTKGTREEVQWRRMLSLRSQVEMEIAGGRRCGFLLRGGGALIAVEVAKSRGDLEVTLGDRVVARRLFPSERGALRLKVTVEPTRLILQPGSDEPLEVSLAGITTSQWLLSLTSNRSQSSFQSLSIVRQPAPPHAGGVPAAVSARTRRLNEARALRMEDATALLEKGEWDDALRRLTDWSDEERPNAFTADSFSQREIALFNVIAAEAPSLRREEPLKTLINATRRRTQDGSLEFHLPFRQDWRVEFAKVRRIGSDLATVESPSPSVWLNLYRYDQRLQYDFGSSPRVHTVGGSSPAALARARHNDQLEELHQARSVLNPTKSRRKIGATSTTEYRLQYSAELTDQHPQEDLILQEYFFAHRGNTHQVSIIGSQEALDRCRTELDWILQSFRFLD
jgi:hypothetical protein